MPREGRKAPRAFCTSNECNRDEYGRRLSRVEAEKLVPLTQVRCPDCKYMLFWKRPPKGPYIANKDDPPMDKVDLGGYSLHITPRGRFSD